MTMPPIPIQTSKAFTTRLWLAALAMFLLLLVVLLRLLDLQVLHYQKFRQLAHNNHVALVPVNPPRGLILADHGEVLAQNQPTFAVELTRDQVPDWDDTLQRLQKLLQLSDQEIEHFSRLVDSKADFEPVVLKAQLTPAQVAALAVRSPQLPGVRVVAISHRNYPYGSLFAHVVGYVGPISAKDLAQHQSGNYRGRDYIGKSGLEKYYERQLRGSLGYEVKQINAEGVQVGTLAEQPPIIGDNLVTHLRLRVQEAAANALESKGYRGAVVALDPKTGAVLAMVSSPSFDANWFIDGISNARWQSLLQNPGHPLVDRVNNGLYPPGSCAKPFYALQAIQSGVISPTFHTYCPGNYQLGGHTYWDWNRAGFGETGVTKSLAWSVDVFYYKLAVKMGIELQDQTLWRFGFGHPTHIDLPGKQAGLVPTPQWKKAHLHTPWYTGDSVILGIGQGYLLVTPLQLARAVSALANGGKLVQPQIAKEWVDPATGKRTLIPFATPVDLHLDPQALHAVHLGMEACVNGGTCRSVAIPGITIAGKTGTAQVPIGYRNGRTLYDNDSLFIGWAPVENPQIAIAVVVENGGHNAWQALPVAKATLTAFFQQGQENSSAQKNAPLVP